ncbi:hypothetical protein Tco_0582643 [Tanacetum coccineum]
MQMWCSLMMVASVLYWRRWLIGDNTGTGDDIGSGDSIGGSGGEGIMGKVHGEVVDRSSNAVCRMGLVVWHRLLSRLKSSVLPLKDEGPLDPTDSSSSVGRIQSAGSSLGSIIIILPPIISVASWSDYDYERVVCEEDDLAIRSSFSV